MLILSLVVVGAASYPKLGVDRFPSVDSDRHRPRSLPGLARGDGVVGAMHLEEREHRAGIEELRTSTVPEQILIVTFALNRTSTCGAGRPGPRQRVAAALPAASTRPSSRSSTTTPRRS